MSRVMMGVNRHSSIYKLNFRNFKFHTILFELDKFVRNKSNFRGVKLLMEKIRSLLGIFFILLTFEALFVFRDLFVDKIEEI